MYWFFNALMFTWPTNCSGSDFEESTSVSQESIIESDPGFRYMYRCNSWSTVPGLTVGRQGPRLGRLSAASALGLVDCRPPVP